MQRMKDFRVLCPYGKVPHRTAHQRDIPSESQKYFPGKLRHIGKKSPAEKVLHRKYPPRKISLRIVHPKKVYSYKKVPPRKKLSPCENTRLRTLNSPTLFHRVKLQTIYDFL